MADAADGFCNLIPSLACLQSFDRVVLAVSGGADSTALMHATAEWHRANPSPTRSILVCTVDHRLRQGSTREAEAVARVAHSLGLEHTIASDPTPPPPQASQAWARDLRYRLLTEVARRSATADQRVAIVTAHHANDQAETILMRLARGSGLDGLAGMRAARRLAPADPRTGAPEILLVRPFLSLDRAALLSTLQRNGVLWIDDPSNSNPRFERVRLRQALADATVVPLVSLGVAATGRRLARALDALDVITDRLICDPAIVVAEPLGCARLNLDRLAREPEDLRLRLMLRLITWLSREQVSLGQLEKRLANLTTSGPGGSLHQVCFLKPVKGVSVVLPERGRRPPVPVATGGQTVRFAAFDCLAHETGLLAPLGPLGLAALRNQGHPLPRAPHKVLLVQPALFAPDGSLRAAPTLSFHPDRLTVELRPLPRGPRSSET